MAASKMHADEIDTDVALVRRLLAQLFLDWADLAIEPVVSYVEQITTSIGAGIRDRSVSHSLGL